MPERAARAPIRSFRDLEVYQRGRELAKHVESLVQRFPEHEKFMLVSQMRRASRSVTANIAEGFAKRDSAREFKRYLKVSLGSANEMEAHIESALDLGFLGDDEYKRLMDDYQILGKQPNRLIATWRSFGDPASTLHPPSSATSRRTT